LTKCKPVKGKQAKINPVPTRAIIVVVLDPGSGSLPGFRSSRIEQTKAKDPANTYI